jgi:hypothetical protein
MKHRTKLKERREKRKKQKQHKYSNNNNIIDKGGFLEIPLW